MIPCFDPVIITEEGLDAVDVEVTRGRSVLRPWMTPKRLMPKILWKYEVSDQLPLRPIPALRARSEILPNATCQEMCRRSTLYFSNVELPPKSFSTCTFNFSKSSTRLTSIFTVSTFPLIADFADERFDLLLSQMMTFMP